MHKSCELLGGRLARKQRDLAAIAHAKGGGDALFELQRDSLNNDKIDKAVAALSSAAGDALGKFGKLFAFGLAQILSRDLPLRFHALGSRATHLMATGDSSQGKWLLWRSTVSREGQKELATLFAFATHEV